MGKFINWGPELMQNVLFNLPQTAAMVICISLYQGITDPVQIAAMYVQAYCASFLLSVLLRLGDVGWMAVKKLHCVDKPVLVYLICNVLAGLIMGVFMNLFMTWMAIGPVSYFFTAYMHTFLISLGVSAVSSCVWMLPVMKLVDLAYPQK